MLTGAAGRAWAGFSLARPDGLTIIRDPSPGRVVPSSSLVQDRCLSRTRHGFESRWDYHDPRRGGKRGGRGAGGRPARVPRGRASPAQIPRNRGTAAHARPTRRVPPVSGAESGRRHGSALVISVGPARGSRRPSERAAYAFTKRSGRKTGGGMAGESAGARIGGRGRRTAPKGQERADRRDGPRGESGNTGERCVAR